MTQDQRDMLSDEAFKNVREIDAGFEGEAGAGTTSGANRQAGYTPGAGAPPDGAPGAGAPPDDLRKYHQADDSDEEDGYGNHNRFDARDAAEADTAPLDSMHLWEGDAGTLPYDARSALLRLVKGPYISESNDPAHWRALLNYTEAIRSRLADLFLDLILDAEAGVAFAKNVTVEDKEFPKAATSYTLTLLDTIMVLLLRKELQTAGNARVFIGQAELFVQMNQYRDIAKLDPAAYLKRLEASWSRLEKQRLLVKSDVEGRYEISPVLKLVFGSEEAQAVFDEYTRMRDELKQGEQGDSDGGHAGPATEEATLFDGLF